ncbi:DNA-binding beta-propeller fold protein YncE [Nonomuraea thailandensis]|uniref:DNA-binding beta-propeller fold protein YncE n=1 Tax=Nonomuraea thailandensis TaxID=1188745 RepID=A0A9X2GY36_9ACTN|nr:WD40 repeat domain-containing protein [Nonomuraea thailandensis]MCP2365822.1 DNA-binding beta-propeller fold protein YncE [Nonomuraea thailandensis]
MAKWGPLRGRYVQTRELAMTLRAIADQQRQSVRGLAEKIPYGRSVISAHLNGARRPEWAFVEAFLAACAGRDGQALQLLRAKVRPLWEAADPAVATVLDEPVEVDEEQAGELVPASVRQWVTMLAEVAGKQQMLARAQLAVTRHQALSAGLLEMLGRLAQAVADLTQERDELRAERDTLLRAQHQRMGLEGELARIRQELLETQERLELAEELYEQTSRRLDQAERQRAQAERLKQQAFAQLRSVLRAADAPSGLSAAGTSSVRVAAEDDAADLMGEGEQQATAEVLSRLDHVLAGEAATLQGLRHDLTIGSPERDADAALPGRSDDARADTVLANTAADTAGHMAGHTAFADADTVSASADTGRTGVAAPSSELVAGPGEQWGSAQPATLTRQRSSDTRRLTLLLSALVLLAAAVPGTLTIRQLYDPAVLGWTPDAVTAVALSPDGKLLAVGSGDYDNQGQVQFWDPATRQPVGDPLTGTQPVNAVAFSPDGKLLAVGSGGSDDQGQVRLWDPATRRPIGDPLTGHNQKVNAVAFSPDGKLLASGSGNSFVDDADIIDFSVRLWDPATRQPVGDPLTGHNRQVEAVAFSPDGKLLAVGSGGYHDQGQVRLWDPATRRPVGDPLTGHHQQVNAVAFSPDGKLLAVGSGDYDQGQVQLWDPATRQPIGGPLNSQEGGVEAVAFSPDSELLAMITGNYANGNDEVRLLDPATRQPVGDPLNPDNTGDFTAVVFTTDSKALVCGGWPADSLFRSSNDDSGIVRLEDLDNWPGGAVPR